MKIKTSAARVASCLSAVVMLGFAPAVLAETKICSGSIGAVTLDNVVVQDGASCVLKGTTLKGSIYVETRSTLSANRVRVNGNIQSEGSTAVYVSNGSVIGGNIQIKQGRRAVIRSSIIGGDLQFEENTGPLEASYNEIDGNLQAFKNTGGLLLIANVIEENMQCKENSPAPKGRDNIAGSKEDQCRRL